MPAKTHNGFTLIELLVVLVLIAVMLRLAAPSFQRLIVDSRMTTQSNELLTSLYFARSEAVKRNVPVSVCKSSNGTTCATSGTWAQGWIVFTDLDSDGKPPANGTVDPPNSPYAGDVVLRAHGALAGGSTLVGRSGLASYVTYANNGQSSPASGSFTLCSNDLTLNGRNITLATGGRPTVTQSTPPLSCS